MSKYTIAGIIVLILLIGAIAAWWFMVQSDKEIIYVDTKDDKPWNMVGGGGDRIYLDYGTIYVFTDDPNKEYNIVNFTLHVTADQYRKLIFFDTPEEAENAGFKASENFVQDYACLKEGKNFFKCSGAKWGYSE